MRAAEEVRAAAARLRTAGAASVGGAAGPMNTERRQRQRRSYPYKQKLAFVVGDQLPDQSEFSEIQCNDIAAGASRSYRPTRRSPTPSSWRWGLNPTSAT